ncbi:MAG: hypothetical protein R3D71_01975 [Rickettsiales bacterium]
MPITDIYNYDFAQLASCQNPEEAFKQEFFTKHLTIGELKTIHDYLQNQQVEIDGKTIKAATYLKGVVSGELPPFLILTQLHGNEPAGLAGVALAIALSKAGMLRHDVICAIGNPLAAKQYFKEWEKSPSSEQETRDAFRCGLDDNGKLLADGNRIPVDFLERDSDYPHTERARELYHIARNIRGIIDIHSARGNMVCITDHKNDNDLKYSPIRAVLTDLAEAISANASKQVTVKTLKTILSPLENIKCQTGIEAGRHEDKNSPNIAAAFTLATLYNQGITSVTPLNPQEDGKFVRYSVQPRITYGDLEYEKTPPSNDLIYMAKEIGGAVEEHQYDEMEAVKKGQIVAVAKPSGIVFRAKSDFSGIFFSKAKKLYDIDPNVDPWPIAAEDMNKIKFCYPCLVSDMEISF